MKNIFCEITLSFMIYFFINISSNHDWNFLIDKYRITKEYLATV